MIQKIRYKLITEGCEPVINENGDAIDLVAANEVTLRHAQAGIAHQQDNEKHRDVKFGYTLIPLGIAIELPKGWVADLKPRSSSFKKWKFLQTNSVGLVDCSYCGDEDEWKLPIIAMEMCHIHKGDRVCQFEVRLSQNATVWQKIKWLFTSGIEFVCVESLNNDNRGGFGSTDLKK